MTQYLLNGVVLGSVYGLLAVAFTMVYSVSGVLNFSFGVLFVVGAFGTLCLSQTNVTLVGHQVNMPGLPLWLAVLGGLAAGAAVGLIVEVVSYRPLINAPVLTLLIAALSMWTLLQSVGQYVFGAQDTPLPASIGGSPVSVAGATIGPFDILTVVAAFVAMALLIALVTWTGIGRAMRATAEDRDAARLMGIGVSRVITTVFVAGSVLSALAGVLYCLKYQFVSPTLGFLPALKGIVAAVLGGVGSIRGAFIGGLVLGLVEEVGAGTLPDGSAYRDVISFLALGLILWLRPRGLFGPRVVERV